MTILSVKAFNGLKPVVKPRLLGDGDAQVAQNARLISGSLEPMRSSTTLKATTVANPKTIFKYGSPSSETNYWLEFANDTDVMRSPIPNDSYDRLYWADGINPPRYAPNTLVLSGQTYPGGYYQLGLPEPTAPNVTVVGTATTGQTFKLTSTLVAGISSPAKIKVKVTTSNGSTETILDITTVTAAAIASGLSGIAGLPAVVTSGDVVVSPVDTIQGVAISIKTGVEENYDATIVTYSSYLQPGDWVNTATGDRIAAVVSGSLISGVGTTDNTIAPAAVLLDPATIAAMAPGTRMTASINGEAPVSVIISAGSGTYPAAVTAQSISNAFASVAGIQTEIRQNATYTVNGSSVTGTFIVIATRATGTAATLLLRKIIPASTDTYSSSYTWARDNNADSVKETRVYVVNYVSAYGEEGPPSAASTSVELSYGQSATVALPVAPSGSYNVTLKRLYRSSTVGNQAQFQFVADVPVAQTTFVDTVAQADLGEVMPSEGWKAPPADLKGLRMMANGAAVGFSGRTVYFSEPNMPHAWPHEYTIDYDIVGIATFGQTVAVLTTAYPFLLQGADPMAMTPTKLEMPQACSSKRGIIETGDGVLYPSPDGYVSIGSSIDVVTKSLFSRDQWAAFNPSSMESYLYNGRIYVLYNNGSRGTLCIDPTGQGAVLTTMNTNAFTAVTAAFYDANRDVMYQAQGGSIVRFDQGTALTATWRSKIFRLPWQQNMSVGQVRAAAYPVTLRIYADGVLKTTQSVTSAEPFLLPGGFRALDWEFEIDSTVEVSEVNIATSIGELKAV